MKNIDIRIAQPFVKPVNARAEHILHGHQPQIFQFLKSAAYHLLLLRCGKQSHADRLGNHDEDVQRFSRVRGELFGRHGGKDIACEVDSFGCQEALPFRVVSELPGLVRDPVDHGRNHDVEPASIGSPGAIDSCDVVKTAYPSRQHRVEEIHTQIQELVFVRQSGVALAIHVVLDSLVGSDDLVPVISVAVLGDRALGMPQIDCFYHSRITISRQ